MGSSRSLVPDFGDVLLRRRLLDVFRCHSPGMVILCAPVGYGKSIVASQFARLPVFERSIWVNLHDVDATGQNGLAQLGVALASDEDSLEGADGAALRLQSMTCLDSMMRIREGLSGNAGEAVCIVIDGANHLSGVETLLSALAHVRRCTSSRSQMVVTCRSLEQSVAFDPSSVWVVESADMHFTVSEVEQLIHACSQGPADAADAEGLFGRFGGHPALTRVALRHPEVDLDANAPQDLLWYAERLVSMLSQELLEGFYVVTLLQEGSIADAQSVLRLSGRSLDWSRLVGQTPLLSVSSLGAAGHGTFRVHAALSEALCRVVASRLDPATAASVRECVTDYLHHTRRHALLLSALEAHGTHDETVHWLECAGDAMLRAAGPPAVGHCLDRVSPTAIAGSWRLLLLRAGILRQQEQSANAMQHASLARRFAENEGDDDGVTEASLLIARIAIDECHFGTVREVLAPLDVKPPGLIAPEAECLVQSYLAAVESHAGALHSAIERTRRTRELLQDMDMSSEAAVFVTNAIASVDGVSRGMWSEVVTLLPRVVPAPGVAPLQKLAIRANYAAALYELGKLDDARQMMVEVVRELKENGLDRQRAYALGTYSAICFASGDTLGGEEAYRECKALCSAREDTFGRAAESATAATGLRAAGRMREALASVEQGWSLIKSRQGEYSLVSVFIRAELAASLLATGEMASAIEAATNARKEIESLPARMLLLRLDLILAETKRCQGVFDTAVECLESHRDYILTGSANTMLSLYVRAFPGLLGVLCAAVGSEDMPLGALRLLPSPTVDAALAAMDGFVSSEVKDALLQRIPEPAPTPVAVAAVALPEPEPTWTCRVRLLGGLEVTTEAGFVDESHWRKRKSRLVFAMLAVRQGQDIARDVIIERLWPHMDEDTARRNFYVTWSTMKKALACGGPPAIGGVYVCTTGNACRLSRLVRSDLDDFSEVVGRMRRGKGEAEAGEIIKLTRKLADIYRGDLLPGDIYEEWFSDSREQLRQDFCDAMVQGALAAEQTGDPATALLFLRRAAAVDSWREDVYQGAMRCQILSGQRSRAIETYMSCRSKLVEDLGIDPSPETARLYRTILAMEEDSAESPERTGLAEEPDEDSEDE